MKKHMLYAPALLLFLSISCGKANHDDKQDLVTSPTQLNSEQPANVGELSSVNPALANPVADEVTPATAPPVTPPAVNGSTAASSPATAAPTAPAVQPARTPPAPSTPAAPVAIPPGSELVPTTLSTGVTEVDAICNKSFAGVEAFIAGDTAALQTLKLTPEINNACYTRLVTDTGALFEEMEVLGLPNLGLGASLPLNKKTWKNLASNPQLVPLFINQANGLFLDEKNNNLADATEELRYIELSIAEIQSKTPADLTSEDKQNLIVMLSSLNVQNKLIERIVNRLNKLNSLTNYINLGFAVAQVNTIFRAPVPTSTGTRPAAQPTSPAGSVTSPTEITNTPTENPSSTGPTPQPTPAPGGPVPAPTPGPVPTPPGGPTPTP